MIAFTKTLSAGALSAVMFVTSLVPAGAVMMPSVNAPQVSAATEVQFRRDNRHDRRVERHRDDRRGFYHGHRGSREYRKGYRRHSDGWWYPLAAFGAGVVIGGALNGQPAQGRSLSSRHVQWCSSQYRTYRASDDTYVPRVGVRARCNSPYN
ncbi:BA14K family protein [Rhizobium sp. SSA_523]|uniref:BA14K family protein n=1 Tax=Rhizobium sp. SSA_523 TaxID=2952477 RepID=UPI002090D61A|nr:BA14K family protein [Rhizobium sp. SSA_523]MCO5734029.1 BA14K family protein [Rhizobium sp. SSA_523]WKC24670.1 BA14K family protein [Rhizobium sp. SSA_523]